MIKISLPYIYDLSASLRPLSLLEQEKSISSSFYVLFRAQSVLNAFVTQSVYSSTLKATRAPGLELLAVLGALVDNENTDQELGFLNVFHVNNALDKFETVLTAEWNIGNAYWVTKKRGYDTSDLIEQAEVLFPHDLIPKVPESISDVRDAGKCIAFELATAAGFHIMRATEVVLRKYWDSVTSCASRPKTNNIGEYLKELDGLKAGNPKTRAVLRQIKDLHRNELIHPEVNLSLDEALSLLGIAQSAMVAMLAEIPGPPSPSETPTLIP